MSNSLLSSDLKKVVNQCSWLPILPEYIFTIGQISYGMIKLVKIVSDCISYFRYHKTNEHKNYDLMHILLFLLNLQYLVKDIGKKPYRIITLYDIQEDCIVFFQKLQNNNYRNEKIILNVHEYLSFQIIPKISGRYTTE